MDKELILSVTVNCDGVMDMNLPSEITIREFNAMCKAIMNIIKKTYPGITLYVRDGSCFYDLKEVKHGRKT